MDDPRDPHDGPRDGFAEPASDRDPEPSTTPPVAADAIPERIGPYRLLELISDKGGMGIVYLAEQEAPFRRRVAIKMIKPGLDSSEILARFESERQALAILDHQHIAKVFDAGTTPQGRAYFVMEYVPGLWITEYADKHRLSIPERLTLFMQVCAAIHHAHQKGIIHRDVKPSNIVITVVDGEPCAKVIDFGVAKATGMRLTERTLHTHLGLVLGTPEYMSPEQAEMSGLDVDTTTDVYSLGVVLYELLVGALPFESQTLREAGYAGMQKIIREQDPPRPSLRLSTLKERAAEIARERNCDLPSLQRQLHGDLEWIIHRAMEKDRTRRYQSVSELAADIQRHLVDEPVVAGPPSVSYRLRKFARRNRALVAGLAAVVAALSLGLAISTSLYIRGERARAAASYAAYVANIRAAAASIDEGEIREARRWLAACPEKLRGWEWKHLSVRSDASLLTIPTDQGRVEDVAVSPDGRVIASAGADSTICLWDVQTGHLIRQLRGHEGAVNAVAFDPTGRLLASGSNDKAIGIWEVSSGKLLQGLLGHQGPIRSLSFSPDGMRLASAGVNDGPLSNRELTIWNVSSGEAEQTLFGVGRLVDFDPGGRWVVTILEGDYDSDAVLVDPLTGKRLLRLEKLDGTIYWLRVGSGGERIFACSGGATMAWDRRTGRRIREYPTHRQLSNGTEAAARLAALGPSGEIVATANGDGSICLWSEDGGSPAAPLRGHEVGIAGLVATPDGMLLVSAGGGDGTIRIWEATVNPAVQRFEEFASNAVCFSPDGKLLYAASLPVNLLLGQVTPYEDRHIRVWDTITGELVARFRGAKERITALALSGDGSRIAGGELNKSVRIWDSKGACLQVLGANLDYCRALAFSPDGRQIAASGSGWIRVWGVASGDSLWALHGPRFGPLLAQRPDGKTIAASVSDGILFLDAASGDSLGNWECGQSTALAWSPDGRWLAAGDVHGTIRIWDEHSRNMVRELRGHDQRVNSIAFSSDGSRLTSGSDDETIRIWDPRTGAMLLTLRDVEYNALAVAFSPDGATLAGSGTMVHLWRTAAPGEGYEERSRCYRLRREATPIVEALFAEKILADSVLSELNGPRGAVLSLDARETAVRMTRVRGDDAWRINEASWALARRPGLDRRRYDEAVRLGEIAARMDPDDSAFQNTLGTALVRAGRCERGIEVLLRSDSLLIAGGHGPSWWNACFRAMAYASLGRGADAHDALERARGVLGTSGLISAEDAEELQGYIREVERMGVR